MGHLWRDISHERQCGDARGVQDRPPVADTAGGALLLIEDVVEFLEAA